MSRQNDEAAALVRAYFGACLDRYGHDPRGVDWQSAAAQRARFAAVLAVGDLDGATLLDAGCGLGDFYGYLRERGIAARYTGCDLSTPHVEAARKAYPDARFVAGDVREILADERFDYVIGCGLLHLRTLSPTAEPPPLDPGGDTVFLLRKQQHQLHEPVRHLPSVDPLELDP